MTTLGYLVAAECLLLVALAAVLALSSRTEVSSKRVRDRFEILSIELDSGDAGAGLLGRLRKRIDGICIRAGIRLEKKGLWLGMSLLVLVIGIVVLRYGIPAGFVALSSTLILLYGFLQFRYRQRAEALLTQLPRFIDNLERSLGAGRSLHAALVQSTDRMSEPLLNVLLRVKNNVELGGNLGEQLQNAANTMAVKEFQLLALAVSVHQRYGGSIKGLLRSITTMVQQREQARREFAALTGETRFSAWVLGVLPLLIAGYMAAINPGYIESMWTSESGRHMLYLALGFQVTGALVLWRMIKSI